MSELTTHFQIFGIALTAFRPADISHAFGCTLDINISTLLAERPHNDTCPAQLRHEFK